MKDFWIYLFLVVSVAFTVSAIVQGIIWVIKPYRSRRNRNFSKFRNPERKIVRFAFLILISVWSLRFAIGLYRNWHSDCFVGLNDVIAIVPAGDQIVNSLLHAFMSFSMDEDFTEYLLTGTKMVEGLFPDQSWLSVIFSVYSAVLNFAAPVAGGAIIFDILTELSPRLRFHLSSLYFWNEKYYFTSLNEQSLALAKSIVTSPDHYHSTIIFTDAYSDDEEEESSERQLSAKAIGAICLKDDLLHIRIKRRLKIKPVRIILSDSKENDNMEMLAALLSVENRNVFQNLEIYVFSSDRKNDNNKVSFLEDEVSYINNRILTELEEKDAEKRKELEDELERRLKKAQEKRDDKRKKSEKKAQRWYDRQERRKIPLPRVVPVNGIRNMAQNLFYDVPLFEGMYGKERGKDPLNLTIFGSGVIGTEMFLNAYWIGQMLDVTLNVTIVSQETEDEFADKIDFLNPEILRTIHFPPRNRPGDKILAFRDGEYSVPYMNLKYISRNVMSTDFMDDLSGDPDGAGLIDSDYFVVALGSDEDNFSVADKLRLAAGYYHMNNKDANHKKTIISYVIYNSELCRNLNRKCRLDNVVRPGPLSEFDVYMHAFGSMEDVYSMANIMFDDVKDDALRAGEEYRKKSKETDKDVMNSIEKKRWRELSTRYYDYRSNIAKRLHYYYKIYSAGYIQPSLFLSSSEKEYWKYLYSSREKYEYYIQSKEKNGDFTLLHRLAWLEHRRWCAFMRVCGFRHPDDFSRYMGLDNDLHTFNEHKFLMLKLHPCLVEASDEGIHAKMTPEGDVVETSEIDFSGDIDRLDEATRERIRIKKCSSKAVNDFKRWDYPFCEKYSS